MKKPAPTPEPQRKLAPRPLAVDRLAAIRGGDESVATSPPPCPPVCDPVNEGG